MHTTPCALNDRHVERQATSEECIHFKQDNEEKDGERMGDEFLTEGHLCNPLKKIGRPMRKEMKEEIRMHHGRMVTTLEPFSKPDKK